MYLLPANIEKSNRLIDWKCRSDDGNNCVLLRGLGSQDLLSTRLPGAGLSRAVLSPFIFLLLTGGIFRDGMLL